MSPHRDGHDDVAAKLSAGNFGTSGGLTTVFRGAGMLLVVFLAYGGWVVLPMAAIAVLIALFRCA